MNGQIQYGSARLLTLRATRGRTRRIADPVRFAVPARRRIHLAAGGSFLLVLLFQTDLPRLAALLTFGAAWIFLVLAMTLPTRSEVAGHELSRRVAQFRHEITAAGEASSRATLEQLIARSTELGLAEDEVPEELEQLRASLQAIDITVRLSRGELPLVEPPDGLAPAAACYFTCPVRHGRRRADQFGHLVMSVGGLHFRGAVDVSVPWADVAGVRRDRREILVALRETSRVLRFSCHSHGEAARGAAIAEHLARATKENVTDGSSSCHASA